MEGSQTLNKFKGQIIQESIQFTRERLCPTIRQNGQQVADSLCPYLKPQYTRLFRQTWTYRITGYN